MSVELLAPAGNFDCLVAAVQNGANAVYFGSDKFSARAYSNNFDNDELVKAINYAKLRNVKTHLTLNTLLKNKEFEDAMYLVSFAYKNGIDAIIVQDLGLAKKIIENFPNLEVHASTQCTVYNLAGVKAMENIGFNRVVLARELSLDEISNICKNSNTEIEVFLHGALCICYSGQCLMSSLIGGRSGNRGKCAGTCRLPYELVNKTSGKVLDKGYLLSSKDVCSLDILPQLIKTGVRSLKIEGRMKSPEYVGLCTSIYRKYIDLADSANYFVDEKDKEKLMQIFNRGGFSTGYLNGKLGKGMMFTKKPNHLGIYLGKVSSYNSNKGHVNLLLERDIDLGDSIAIGNSSCKISELMKKNVNIKTANIGQNVIIGRIKGNIHVGDKVYKTVSAKLNKDILYYSSKENIKRLLNCKIEIKSNTPIKVFITDILSNKEYTVQTDFVATYSETASLSQSKVINQFSKTGNTFFEFKNIVIDIEDNLTLPVSSINEIRRLVLNKLEGLLIDTFKRNTNYCFAFNNNFKKNDTSSLPKTSILFNELNSKFDYTTLNNIDNVYIPFAYFLNNDITNTVSNICKNFNTFLYLPNITKGFYENLILNNISKIINMGIKGVVISNLSQMELLKDFISDLILIANYTLNINNNFSISTLSNLGLTKFTVSPEFDIETINSLSSRLEKEVIVYGRAQLMASEYCPIGTFHNCKGTCSIRQLCFKR